MAIHRAWPLILIGVLAMGGCLHRAVSQPVGTSLDEACSTAEKLDAVRLDTFAVGPAEFAMPTGWSVEIGQWQALRLTRLDAALNVWTGTPLVNPGRLPPASIRCTVSRGDTTIRIEAMRIGGLRYRVEAEWELEPNEAYFYMQWITPHVQHLRQVRAIVDGVRFPTDTARAARGAGGAPAMGR